MTAGERATAPGKPNTGRTATADAAQDADRTGGSSLLRVADLSVRIAGLHILQGVSFEVASSGVTVLLGRNGVGKSTTLRAILGLTPRNGAATGSVRLGGEEILGRPTHALVKAGLGFVPEDRCVFAGLTVAENLRLAERTDTPDYDLVFGLFPELSKRAKQRAGSLSGGQQQMLSLGRVLLNPNKLLLIDEPTKGLAPKVVTEVAEALERAAQAVPVLLVEQNLAVVRRLAGDAVVIAAGQVAWTGPGERLLADPALTKSLLAVNAAGGH
ncbi:ABC transporter ATP-binding protein [Catellatospora coxensis]|uniref:ABC transporter ATP-binding protein n=1 Tax=Catellatospora coxensis TaxID=310354 RepID=A0A8J3L2A8_9ACTN|nr:ABC transporter ATP-binding protein [Catellatospora coxensis]GIG10702.1 ABC transporter ATP-binding protein [Catellatospora coxensis]